MNKIRLTIQNILCKSLRKKYPNLHNAFLLGPDWKLQSEMAVHLSNGRKMGWRFKALYRSFDLSGKAYICISVIDPNNNLEKINFDRRVFLYIAENLEKHEDMFSLTRVENTLIAMIAECNSELSLLNFRYSFKDSLKYPKLKEAIDERILYIQNLLEEESVIEEFEKENLGIGA